MMVPLRHVVYYVIFSWAIRHFDLPTVGRADDDTAEEEEHVSIEESGYIHALVENLGGAANLLEISSCITRLRLKVRDSSAIDEAELKKLGARGVIAKGQAVQVIIGTEAEHVADEMKRYVKQ